MKTEDENNLDNNEDNGFGLPEDYFQTTAKTIMDKMEWEEEVTRFPLLFNNWRPQGFSLPEHYFEKNEAAFEKLIYPALHEHKDSEGFGLPNDYFKNVAERLEHKILQPNPSPKIISISRSFVPWTIAALLVMSIGIWIYSVLSPTDVEADCKTMACIERRDIVNSGHLDDLENDELYQLVNPVHLEKNIKEHIIPEGETQDTISGDSANDLMEDL